MGVLTKEEIKAFLALDIGGNGAGSGDGFGSGTGEGCGLGDNIGYPDGHGYGYGYSSGSGYGDGVGYGYGYGSNCIFGVRGDLRNDYSFGTGYFIKEINGYTVYCIDGVNTIITSIRGNTAQGFILEEAAKLVPCYIVKENNKFAHGKTLHEAFMSLQEKLYDDSTEEERVEAFKEAFPQYDTKYSNADLFAYHHILTGSCRMGRESFVNSKGLSLDDKTTIREFIELTKDAYGGGIIKKLPREYGIVD